MREVSPSHFFFSPKNPSFMTIQCAPTCYTCHLIDFDSRCPYDDTQPTFLNPGDLHKMFERLTTDAFYVNNYHPTIHMMPDPTSQEIKDGPWVVTLENLLTDEECDRLIRLGGNEGYEISKDVGPKKFDGSFEGYANDRRTSTNAWCQDECFNDATTQAVLAKIVNVTGVPDANSEYLQLLRYEEGQFYKTYVVLLLLFLPCHDVG
jgi:prolyl 4-hydroxylase